MSTERCVLTHSRDPERPRRPVPGLLLCHGHLVHGVAGDLAELPTLDRRLAERHNPGGSTGPKTSGSRDLGLRFDPRIAAMRGDIYTALAGWARTVAAEGHWHLPAEDTVTGIASWLLGYRGTRLRWTAAYPWIGEYADDIHRITREAFALAYPSGRRRVDVGPCRRPIACDVTTRAVTVCAGTIRATVHDIDDLLPAELICDECAWPVPAREWLTLARRLGRTTAWLTGEQLHTLWGDVPIGTIRYWAHTDRWPRLGRYPTRYDAAHAQHTYDTRRIDA